MFDTAALNDKLAAMPEQVIDPAKIADAAENPQAFSVDGLSQTNRSVSDLIAADKYLRKRKLAQRGCRGLGGLISHAVPPAPVS